MRGVRDDQLTVGVPDLGGHFRGTTGWVDPHDRGPREGGTAQPKDEVGHVVQQHADMEGPVCPQLPGQRTPRGGFIDNLIPCPVAIAGA
ncbi:Uncharacterised protein [Mycobacteroides abscessus subsp. abscessus]|nr:Uncharacterised protein [Mycobacteroides abscessus subsp. abscessus]